MPTSKTWSKTTEPTSYNQIYDYVERTLEQCSSTIDVLEKDYYQGASTSLNFAEKNFSPRRTLSVNTLLAWSRPLNELRNARSVNDIRNGKNIRDLLNEVKMGSLNGPVSDESVFLIGRIMQKTKDQLDAKIASLANQIGECMELMEQYFLSFFNIENIQDIIQKKKKEKTSVSDCLFHAECLMGIFLRKRERERKTACFHLG